MARFIESVILSAYMMTWPSTLRAARPIVWTSDVSRAQEPLLVGVEDRHQRHLGQVEALAQQVDADEHVELAEAQGAQDLDALHGVDVGVQVAHPEPLLEQVVGEVLGHLLGQRRDEHAVALGDAVVDVLDEVVDLALRGLDDRPRGRRGRSGGRSARRPGPTPAARTAPGVADMNTHWLIRSSTSSNVSGRLSRADGRRKPCSTSMSLRLRSPSYCPCSCGTAWWLSSMTSRKSSGK